MIGKIIWNWAGLFITGVVGVVITPLMIHKLGALQYGLWILVSSLLDYYGLLDLGIRAAVFRFAARYSGMQAREELDETFVSSLSVSGVICAAVCVLSLLLAGVLPPFFLKGAEGLATFRWLVMLIGTSLGLAFPTRILASYLSALQRWDLFNLAPILTVVTRAILIVAVLRAGYGVLEVGVVTFAISVAGLFIHLAFVLRADRNACFDWRRTRWARVRELFGFSFHSSLLLVGDYLRFYSDSIVIARVLAISLVTPFSVAGKLIEYFKQIIIAAGGPISGEMSELDGQGKEDELRHLFVRSTRMMALLVVLGGSLLILNGKALIELWVGKELLPSYPILVLLAAAYIIGLAQQPSLLAVIARAQHGPLGWWTVAEGLANLGLSIYWAKEYGIIGVALGTVVPMLFIKLIVQPWYTLKSLRLSAWAYVSQALARPAVVCALFLGACALAGVTRLPADPAVFVGTLFVETAFFWLLAYFVGISAEDRARLTPRFQQLLRLRAGEKAASTSAGLGD